LLLASLAAAASQSAILAAAGSTLFEHVVGRALAVALLGYAALLLVAVMATATRLPLTLVFNPTATAEAVLQVGAVMLLLLMLLTFLSAVARRRVLGSAGASGEVARGVGPHPTRHRPRRVAAQRAVVDEWTKGRFSGPPAITIRTVPGDLGPPHDPGAEPSASGCVCCSGNRHAWRRGRARRRGNSWLRGETADEMRAKLEIGPKGKKVVAVAPDWPGLERGAKTGEAAIERLLSYLPRYAPVAKLAGMDAEFAAVTTTTTTTIDVVEQYPGVGSTDFWGISFAFSGIDMQDMSSGELARELTLMQACWAFFDEKRSRVSAEMQQGPRGGGRQRDQIVRHVVRTEQEEWAKKLGLLMPQGMLPTDEVLKAQRDAYCTAIRAFHAQGKMARTWPLRYLIRHTAYHTLDHAWEMEDKDLTAKRA